jgi:hypothetical protein
MSTVSESLSRLSALDKPALAAQWIAAFDCPPPRSSQSTLLVHILAWHMQVQASPDWRGPGALARLARSLRPSTSRAPLTPGIRLLRQWKDRTHEVTVLDQGFEYEGKVYRSLSAIARQISGTPWSGPAFFGFNK